MMHLHSAFFVPQARLSYVVNHQKYFLCENDRYSTEICKKSQTKIVTEGTFTSLVIAANEFFLHLTDVTNLLSSFVYTSLIHVNFHLQTH